MGHVFNYNLPLDKADGVDTSQDTVAPEDLLEGVTAHDCYGDQITGTHVCEGGYDEGEAAGFEAGKKSEYDSFWDVYQQNGNRMSYSCGFSGGGWNDATFKPKYNIIVSNGYMMFRESAVNMDLQEILDGRGIILDTSACTSFSYFIYGTKFKRIGVINFTSAKSISNSLAYNNSLKTIDKVILSPNNTFDGVFIGDTVLENLTIEGVIGQNGFNVSWSPLDKASLTSIVNVLSSTTTGLTVTLRLNAVNTAFETSAGAADGSTSDEWLALAATKSNWNIALINS